MSAPSMARSRNYYYTKSPIHSATISNIIDGNLLTIQNAKHLIVSDSDTTQCSDEIENSSISKTFDDSPFSKKNLTIKDLAKMMY